MALLYGKYTQQKKTLNKEETALFALHVRDTSERRANKNPTSLVNRHLLNDISLCRRRAHLFFFRLLSTSGEKTPVQNTLAVFSCFKSIVVCRTLLRN